MMDIIKQGALMVKYTSVEFVSQDNQTWQGHILQTRKLHTNSFDFKFPHKSIVIPADPLFPKSALFAPG